MTLDKKYFDKKCIQESISIYNVDTKKIILFIKYSYGNKGDHKYYIGHMGGDHSFRLTLYIILPEMDAYFKYFNSGNTNMNFLVMIRNC